MVKQYLAVVEDVVSMLVGELEADEYNKLVDVDFKRINEAVEQFGERFVLIDSIRTLTAKCHGDMEHSIQIAKFISPNKFLLIRYNDTGVIPYNCNTTDEVLEYLLTFINESDAISISQSEDINNFVAELIQ